MKFLTEENLQQLEGVIRFLSRPGRLRLLCLVTLGAVGYAAVFAPLSDRYRRTRSRQREAEEKVLLIRDIERTRKSVEKLEKLFPPVCAQPSWWADQVVTMCKASQVGLIRLNPRPLGETVGGYERIEFTVEVKGRYLDLVRFIHDVELATVPMRIHSMNLRRNKDGSRRGEIVIRSFRPLPGVEGKA